MSSVLLAFHILQQTRNSQTTATLLSMISFHNNSFTISMRAWNSVQWQYAFPCTHEVYIINSIFSINLWWLKTRAKMISNWIWITRSFFWSIYWQYLTVTSIICDKNLNKVTLRIDGLWYALPQKVYWYKK